MPANVPEAPGEGEADQLPDSGTIARFRAYDAAISHQIRAFFERRGRPASAEWYEGILYGWCMGTICGAVSVFLWFQIY
ncbi:hypothetical protein [Methanomassiliicoccus luminyensis]|uniref:hypothetical protein n=1 Tax=Methanomassiliicoccus luminyensis TaxID=1080712 RepID=UPI000366E910|nr:hypothetical protein [Methanomassiliicoccus luminyensis]